MKLDTERLILVQADEHAMEAELIGPSHLGQTLKLTVAADWPPLHWGPGPIEWILGMMRAMPEQADTRPWYITLRQQGLIIGTVGFKGPPDPEGTLEFGYSVVSSQHRRGYATEAVAAMRAQIAHRPDVRRLVAHTLAGDPASGGVLRKNGLMFVGTREDPEDGTLDRYELVLDRRGEARGD
jgi:[ribosomal protein S5]-alanine N-acetyltransferase